MTEDNRCLSPVGWRKLIFSICCATVAGSLSAQVFSTVGVYDPSNGVNFVATGSTVSLAQFKSDVAAAFSNNYGGVNQCSAIGGSAGPYNLSYGVNQNKQLSLQGGTNDQIGITSSSPQAQAISGDSLWVSLVPQMIFFTTNISSGMPNEGVVEFGLTILSTSYFGMSNVIATARFSGGSQATASRTINEAGGLGNTFFDFAAPKGQTIVSLTFTNTAGRGMFFDDIGFVTAAWPLLKLSRPVPQNFQISWPTNFTGYSLEYATNLAAPVWTTDTNAQTVVGSQTTVNVGSVIGQRFYRLRTP